jgi:hypothetical protein
MSDYQVLLTAARHDPISADFRALRLAYTQSSAFSPSVTAPLVATCVSAALRHTDPGMMIDAIQTALETDYLDIEAHRVAVQIYNQVGREARATFHDLFAQGLIQSILTVEGSSFDSAFEVISRREADAVVGVLGLHPQARRNVEANGAVYDIVRAVNRETGAETELFFKVGGVSHSFDIPPLIQDEDRPSQR